MKKIFAFVVAVFALTMMIQQGALAQNSPDGSTITPSGGGTLTTSAGTWSFGSSTSGGGNAILLNGSLANYGYGVLLLVYNGGNMYTNAADSTWWEWNGSGWSQISGDPRGGCTPSASGTTIPSASSITDSNCVVWTVDGSGNSYENGTADGGANITLLLYYNGNIYGQITDGSWWEHGSSGWYEISGDPRSGVQPYRVSAPNGYHWTTTFDDEFTQDSSINTSYWNGGASNTDWCNVPFWEYVYPYDGGPGGTYMFGEPSDNPCEDNYGGLSLDSTNGLTMATSSGPSPAMTTGGPNASSANFIQKYGYWEARMKLPANGDHSDFWMHPIPEGVISRSDGQSELVDWCPEINVAEKLDSNSTYVNFNAHDCNGTSPSANAGDANNDDLTQGFHTYGLYWVSDGSAEGTIYMYLDGNQVLGPYTWSDSNSNLDSGIYIFLHVDESDNSPFQTQYVRVWRLDSN